MANIHWGGIALIKNVSKGREKSLQWGGYIVLLTCCEMEFEIIKTKQIWTKNILLLKASLSEKTVF